MKNVDSIIETIEQMRKEKKIKKHELAASCGISTGYYYKITEGFSQPKLSVLKAMCECVGLEVRLLVKS